MGALATSVLIVGADPAGSMTGIRLLQQGIDCLLVYGCTLPDKRKFDVNEFSFDGDRISVGVGEIS